MIKKQHGDNRREQLQGYLTRDLIPYFEKQGYKNFDAVDQALNWLKQNHPKEFQALKPNRIDSPTNYLPPNPLGIGNALVAETYAGLRGKPYNFLNPFYGQSPNYPGGQRSLSETAGVTNPLGAFALDMIDPSLLTAAGSAAGKKIGPKIAGLVEQRALQNADKAINKVYTTSGWERGAHQAQGALEKLYDIQKRLEKYPFNKTSQLHYNIHRAKYPIQTALDLPLGVLRPTSIIRSARDIGADIANGAGANNSGVFRLNSSPGALAKRLLDPYAASHDVRSLALSAEKDLPKNVYPPQGLQMFGNDLYSIMREAPGKTISSSKGVKPTFGQYRDFINTYKYLDSRQFAGDVHTGNVMYDPNSGFSFIDLTKFPSRGAFSAKNPYTPFEALRELMTGSYYKIRPSDLPSIYRKK